MNDELSPQIRLLLKRLETAKEKDDWSTYEGPRFVTNEIASKAGSMYEKLRYVVDYKDENTIQRVAIERMLKRLLMFEDRDKIGNLLLGELVRVGYIENDTLPEVFAHDVQNIVDKHTALESRLPRGAKKVWTLASAEIHEMLFPATSDEAVVEAMYNTLVDHVKPKEEGVLEDKLFRFQLYIACRRVLLKDGQDELVYSLFSALVPEWKGARADNHEVVASVAESYQKTINRILDDINSPINWNMSYRLKNHGIYFAVIRDIVTHYGTGTKEILEDPERRTAKVHDILNGYYKTHRAKITRSGTHAITYILVTKVIVGLALELPYEMFILEKVNYLALGINIAFSPLLLMAMVKTVKLPGADNSDKIAKGVENMIEDNAEIEPIYASTRSRDITQNKVFLFFYAFFFSLSFGAVIWTLIQLGFNWVSIGLFLVFLCFVSYFGLRIRHRAREWTLEQTEESFMGLMWHLFTLPIARTGRYLATKLSSINVIVLFMDFILETPFKIILGSFDSFVSFVKETRGDAV